MYEEKSVVNDCKDIQNVAKQSNLGVWVNNLEFFPLAKLRTKKLSDSKMQNQYKTIFSETV